MEVSPQPDKSQINTKVRSFLKNEFYSSNDFSNQKNISERQSEMNLNMNGIRKFQNEKIQGNFKSKSTAKVFTKNIQNFNFDLIKRPFLGFEIVLFNKMNNGSEDQKATPILMKILTVNLSNSKQFQSKSRFENNQIKIIDMKLRSLEVLDKFLYSLQRTKNFMVLATQENQLGIYHKTSSKEQKWDFCEPFLKAKCLSFEEDLLMVESASSLNLLNLQKGSVLARIKKIGNRGDLYKVN